MVKSVKPTKKPNLSFLTSLYLYVNDKITAINDSKIFAGIMIIIINIASKFINFKVSKTVESYLKFNFSRNILVFAITWMGTRDIYIATVFTILFVLISDFILNEDSDFCCLPKSYTTKQVARLNRPVTVPSEEDVIKAKIILEKAGGFKEKTDLADAQMTPVVYKESFSVNINGM